MVGVNLPMKAPSMHIQNTLLGKNCLSSHCCHFVQIIFSKPNFFMHMFNVSTLYRQSIKCFIKNCGRSSSAHEGTIYAYRKALLGKNCLSSHSCHFVKKIFFSELNSFMHMFNVSTLHRKSIKLFHQKLY